MYTIIECILAYSHSFHSNLFSKLLVAVLDMPENLAQQVKVKPNLSPWQLFTLLFQLMLTGKMQHFSRRITKQGNW